MNDGLPLPIAVFVLCVGGIVYETSRCDRTIFTRVVRG